MTNTAVATEGFTFFRGDHQVWVDADEVQLEENSRYVARKDGNVVAYFTGDYSTIKGRHNI